MYATGQGISYIALSVCETMRNPDLEVWLAHLASNSPARKPFTRDAVPPILKSLAYRLIRSPASLHRFCEFRYLRWLAVGDVAYVWPGASVSLCETVVRRGHRLVVECINSHMATARDILDEAHERLGLPPTHGITEATIRDERAILALAAAVFAPSPLVRQSLLDNGVPADRVLSVSYGWDRQRLSGTARALPSIDGLTVLFTGTACVRKGAHLLLDAWSRAGIRGRLVLAGHIEPEIAASCAKQLNRPDVVCMGHVADVGAVYRSADIFAFPSLEEGSPLVSYEAMACGLPVVLSPMAAGAVVRHEQEGYVLDPYHRKEWIDALRRLAADGDLRRRFGEAAARRAEEFTWESVGRTRRDLLLKKFAAC
jgi:glycosyltransferase involved in cell wall biosynthesis